MVFVNGAGVEGRMRMRPGAVIAVFTATLFMSALLLFLIQPMFAKMALPRLGGSSAVWSLALVFFQAVLLLGYGYAHLLVRLLSVRMGVVVHAGVMLLALASLPVGIAAGWETPPEQGQALWLIGLFGVSVGLPFFAVSANAPLIQAWYAMAGQARSEDPYFLYAASNAGSFAALLTYPFAIEPLIGLLPQAELWSLGYVLLILLVAACGVIAARAGAGKVPHARAAEEDARPAWQDRLRWVALAFVPSGLLVSTTAFITTDLVAAPFMWVIPLALYLLTFILAFKSRPLGEAVTSRLLLYAAPLTIFSLFHLASIYMLPVHLGAAFLLMLACHCEVARRRPPALRLTAFFFLVSLGGVLGGAFASLAAPNLFSGVTEHPLLMLLAYVVVSVSKWGRACFSRRFWLAAAAFPVLVGATVLAEKADGLLLYAGGALLVCCYIALLMAIRREPLAMAGILATAMVSAAITLQGKGELFQTRSFFGVHKVSLSEDGRFHDLSHGSTLHGWQRIRDDEGRPVTGRPELQSYYYEKGPYGTAVRLLRQARGSLDRVAVVGLGTGTMLCLAQPGEDWRFYEIDPEVVAIAQNPQYFTFLRDCGPPGAIVIGDGRLRLAAEPEGSFDLIVLDAFSSDSIPAHLLTLEALGLYLSRLKPGGLIIFHLSNRYMELSSVVEAAALRRGLEAWSSVTDAAIWSPDTKRRDMMGHLTVVGKTPGSLPVFDADPRWTRARDDRGVSPWTDDYSNIIGAIWRHDRMPGALEK